MGGTHYRHDLDVMSLVTNYSDILIEFQLMPTFDPNYFIICNAGRGSIVNSEETLQQT